MKEKNPRNCGEVGLGLQAIVRRLLANQNICKMLYYTDKDPLGNEDIKDTTEFYEDLIRVTPRLLPEENAHSYIIPMIVNGIKNRENDEFRDFLIKIYVYVPMEQWVIKDSNLRPFALLGEIQKSLNEKYISGLGTLQGGDFKLNLLSDNMTCYTIDFTLLNYD